SPLAVTGLAAGAVAQAAAAAARAAGLAALARAAAGAGLPRTGLGLALVRRAAGRGAVRRAARGGAGRRRRRAGGRARAPLAADAHVGAAGTAMHDRARTPLAADQHAGVPLLLDDHRPARGLGRHEAGALFRHELRVLEFLLDDRPAGRLGHAHGVAPVDRDAVIAMAAHAEASLRAAVNGGAAAAPLAAQRRARAGRLPGGL